MRELRVINSCVCVCICTYIVKIHRRFTYIDLYIHFLASLFNPVGALRPSGSPYVGPPSFLHSCFLSSPLLFSILSAHVWRNCGWKREANVGRSIYRQKWVLIVTSAKCTLWPQITSFVTALTLEQSQLMPLRHYIHTCVHTDVCHTFHGSTT